MREPKYQFKPKIAPAELAIIIAMIVIMVIMSTQVHLKHPLKVANPMDAAIEDPRLSKIVASEGAQVVPGKSVGNIKLDTFATEANKALGKPTMSDAAMCKSWERWEWGKTPYLIEILQGCNPKKDMRPTILQIRFTGIPFATQEDISPKSTFSDIKKHFDNLVIVKAFTSKKDGKKYVVMDQKEKGIAFIVDAKEGKPDPRGKNHMIIVHLPGESANTYLQSEWSSYSF